MIKYLLGKKKPQQIYFKTWENVFNYLESIATWITDDIFYRDKKHG